MKYTLLNVVFSAFKRKENYSSREYYYKRLSEKNEGLSTYFDLMNVTHKKKVKTSTRLIHFEGKVSNQLMTIADVIDKYGKPQYKFFKKHLSLSITVLFYKLMFGSQKVKLELHFHNNLLFHYNTTFSYLNNESKNLIINIFRKKYLNGDQLDIKNDCIVDSKNSSITFSDNMDFIVNYSYCMGSLFFKNIFKELQCEENKKELLKQRKIKDLYDKL
ncbi:MAG: hypothetical protein JKY19_07545 [Alcanivoracaceae bacterium]|nr:hypothetical protein [Alcanivoracaceae bacterium]